MRPVIFRAYEYEDCMINGFFHEFGIFKSDFTGKFMTKAIIEDEKGKLYDVYINHFQFIDKNKGE